MHSIWDLGYIRNSRGSVVPCRRKSSGIVLVFLVLCAPLIPCIALITVKVSGSSSSDRRSCVSYRTPGPGCESRHRRTSRQRSSRLSSSGSRILSYIPVIYWIQLDIFNLVSFLIQLLRLSKFVRNEVSSFKKRSRPERIIRCGLLCFRRFRQLPKGLYQFIQSS